MRIQFETLGGFAYFPGLQKPIRIDTERLPTLQAGEIESMVRAAILGEGRADMVPDAD